MRYCSVRALLVVLSLFAILAAAAGQEDQAGAGLPDVLVLRDGGTRLVGTLVSFDGTDFSFQALGQTLTIPRQHVLQIHLSVEDVDALNRPPVLGPGAEGDGARTERARPGGKSVLYVPSGEDPLMDDGVRRALSAAGYEVKISAELPTALDNYAVVVLASGAASEPTALEELRRFIAKGGGFVLAWNAPFGLAGSFPTMFGGGDASEIAEWVGAAGFSNKSWWALNYDLEDPSIRLGLSDPFGRHRDWSAGDVLWAAKGKLKHPWTAVEKLAERTIVVAHLLDAHRPGEFAVSAYAHEFGQGRVYFQSLPHATNSPKLIDLFVSGVQWAAGDVDEVVP